MLLILSAACLFIALGKQVVAVAGEIGAASKKDSSSGGQFPDSPAHGRGGSTYTRPEDRGEDVSQLSSKVLVERLARSDDRIEQRKCARTLGDRAIAKEFRAEEVDSKLLEKYIDAVIQGTAAKHKQGDERFEANSQIQRLWSLAVPQLLDKLGDPNPAIQEAMIKNLCLMRNEAVVKELIAGVEATNDPKFRSGGIFALGMMREKRDPLVPNRKVLDDAASQELADRLILPFFDRLEKADPDPSTRKVLQGARKFLAEPFDARPKRVGTASPGNTPLKEAKH